MSNVHVITPIVTKGFRQHALPAPDGCNITVTQISQGPSSIESAVDEVLAAPGVIDSAVKAQAEGADAIIIDCMLDPGLDATRESVSIPVIGCGEAAMRAAGDSFAVITVLQRQERAFADLAAKYGLSDMLNETLGIGVPVLYLKTDREAAIAATVERSKQVVTRGATAIVFGCTGMLGFAKEVSIQLDGIKVIDPLPNAIIVAHEFVQNNQKTDKVIYPYPDRKPIVGFEKWCSLNAMMQEKKG